jgi:hypothetical protein
MKKNWYVQIHSSILLDTELNSNEKLLIALIHNLSSDKGYCYANNGYLSDVLNVGKVRVSGIISGLISKGYLEREIIFKDNKQIDKRLIRLTKPLPIIKNFNSPININDKKIIQNDNRGIIKNDKDNIQVINKIKI